MRNISNVALATNQALLQIANDTENTVLLAGKGSPAERAERYMKRGTAVLMMGLTAIAAGVTPQQAKADSPVQYAYQKDEALMQVMGEQSIPNPDDPRSTAAGAITRSNKLAETAGTLIGGGAGGVLANKVIGGTLATVGGAVAGGVGGFFGAKALTGPGEDYNLPFGINKNDKDETISYKDTPFVQQIEGKSFVENLRPLDDEPQAAASLRHDIARLIETRERSEFMRSKLDEDGKAVEFSSADLKNSALQTQTADFQKYITSLKEYKVFQSSVKHLANALVAELHTDIRPVFQQQNVLQELVYHPADQFHAESDVQQRPAQRSGVVKIF